MVSLLIFNTLAQSQHLLKSVGMFLRVKSRVERNLLVYFWALKLSSS